MSKLENIETELVDLNDSKIISTKLAAVNNNVRFSILEILRDFQVTFNEKNTNFKKEPLYYREINSYLADNYNINITPQMLGQHLKQLLKADLIEEVNVKKEIPNKVGLRTVKAYKLKEDAFEDLFLDINFLSDELLYFFDLYCVNQKFKDDECCVLTIFNGVDKGKSFKVNNDETVLIGRKDNFENSDFSSLVDSIIYDTAQEYATAMEKAINLTSEEYANMQNELAKSVEKIYEKSLENLKGLING